MSTAAWTFAPFRFLAPRTRLGSRLWALQRPAVEDGRRRVSVATVEPPDDGLNVVGHGLEDAALVQRSACCWTACQGGKSPDR